ncbi:hypothetical protein QIH85_43030 [Bradyrhizobium japonicum]|uniref:hypothetical protein n=1 Tax=Bradyrhizobium japonicum TaxID=375 RepID=UPI001E5DDD1B|nr:hypothetical protein [Bradyrhizobium japonicum]MCD9898138.1 hypothetical protein [Bradyrhizobium japonicum]WLB28507.1 hypothetical protein QIH85_43030 [Bradyrhizobium japonicum]WRJ84739.1 hypothetical protein R3F78_07625 [Bradyrhizobium japonicum]WRJ93709.1 hypothetical protein R3F77_05335 [Bradyrhizobium japonicum]WRK47561.1 hypothetical protein R3F73_05395 [Bradyrhizobium japonicum]
MTINGFVHGWDRHRHRGIAELDNGETVQVDARNLGAARRLPEWRGPFDMRPGDRAEFVLNDDGDVVDVLRVW